MHANGDFDIIPPMHNVPDIGWNNSRPLRFLVVGVWNFVFGYGVFAGLYWMFQGIWYDWFIATVAAVLGITMSFITHRLITYRSHGCWWREYLRFYVVYGGQSLLSVFLIWLFVTQLGLNAYIVGFAINVSLTVASYWAHKSYSFKGTSEK